MTKSSASSVERISTCRCLYDSLHFNSRERMLAATSDFSCAAKGITKPASKQKVRAELTRVRIASMSHSRTRRASSLSGAYRSPLTGGVEGDVVTTLHCSHSVLIFNFPPSAVPHGTHASDPHWHGWMAFRSLGQDFLCL